MRLTSIQSKINLIFLIAFLLLLIHFVGYFKIEQELIHEPAINTHERLSTYAKNNRLSRDDLILYLQSVRLQVQSHPHEVLSLGEYIKATRGFDTIFYQEEYYLHIKAPHFRVLFKDMQDYPQRGYTFLILYALIFILLIVLYIWLRKSLTPLFELKKQINSFAQGNLDVNCKSDKKDEIAEVANEFDQAVSKIKLLLQSRQLFLRTIMHELKTPIAKGRIVSELIEEEKQKNRMAVIFDKLDFLIDDFARIEQVVSQNYELDKTSYRIEETLNYAMKMLLIENIQNRVIIKIEDNELLSIDYDLMAMAFKNLIDNALKYSDDKRLCIHQQKGQISFISKGEALEESMDIYFKPYHHSAKSKTHGMGLGLYIVKTILNMHQFDLEYKHHNHKNIFKINYTQK